MCLDQLPTQPRFGKEKFAQSGQTSGVECFEKHPAAAEQKWHDGLTKRDYGQIHRECAQQRQAVVECRGRALDLRERNKHIRNLIKAIEFVCTRIGERENAVLKISLADFGLNLAK